MSNFLELEDQVLLADLAQADFTNCIIDGSILEGAEVSLGNEDGAAFNHQFNNCLIRTDLDPLIDFNNAGCLFNQDPMFEDIFERDYRIDTGSVCIDAGTFILTEPFVNDDLNGNIRPFAGSLPDLGAYEWGYE